MTHVLFLVFKKGILKSMFCFCVEHTHTHTQNVVLCGAACALTSWFVASLQPWPWKTLSWHETRLRPFCQIVFRDCQWRAVAVFSNELIWLEICKLWRDRRVSLLQLVHEFICQCSDFYLSRLTSLCVTVFCGRIMRFVLSRQVFDSVDAVSSRWLHEAEQSDEHTRQQVCGPQDGSVPCGQRHAWKSDDSEAFCWA